MKNETSEKIINCFSNYFGIFRCIRHICTENAPVFASSTVKQCVESVGSVKIASNALRSEARSISERFNALLQTSLMSLTFPDSTNWKKLVQLSLYLMNQKIGNNKISSHGLQ